MSKRQRPSRDAEQAIEAALKFFDESGRIIFDFEPTAARDVEFMALLHASFSARTDGVHDEEKTAVLIQRVNIDSDAGADRALRGHAMRLILSAQVLPKPLARYVAEILRGERIPIKQAGTGRVYVFRDDLVREAIHRVKELGFRPTRNRESRGTRAEESACSIVSEALSRRGVELAEGAIEKIWGQRSRDYTLRFD